MIRRAALVLAAVSLLAGLAAVLLMPRGDREAPPTVAVVDALGGTDAGFARALAPRPITFPDAHGPHPGFRTEWWYYTGNLATPAGRRFGYQLTFFRIALAATPPSRRSAWAARDAWMAHFAITDVGGGRFHARHRLARSGLDLAGASARPFRVWLEDWSAAATRPDGGTMRLRARDGDLALDLALAAAKAPVLQGDRGFSRKGPETGNASYYYSLTRLHTRGEILLGAERLAVAGTSWMDREWSMSALGPGQVGWDWFALQLADGRELMVYRLRRADERVDPFSAGRLVAPDGTSLPLAAGDVAIDVLDGWTSPRTKTRYPSRWRIAVPRAGLTLTVTPRLADQEWTAPLRYWEGAVDVGGAPGGEGYVELVGYGDPGAGRLRLAR